LIIATPTGSTGYSLSCGGPIIVPQSENFVITPIAPHNLNVRPIVVSDKYVISLEVEGRSQYFLASLDSRSVTIDSSIQLAARKENFMVNIVRLDNENFLGTIRNKLMWGLDLRN
jgi:NAD+ kinase